MDFVRLNPLGRLKITRVYDYYDEPLLFLAENKLGWMFIVMKVDVDRWLIMPVSSARLKEMESGRLQLLVAMKTPEMYLGEVKQSDGKPPWFCPWVNGPLDKILWPAEDLYLKLDEVITAQVTSGE